jgi:hypothetical protein
MSYQSQWNLNYDKDFDARSRACTIEQALSFTNSADVSFKALADSLLRSDNPQIANTFVTIVAGSPGFADASDDGEGGVNSDAITDAMLVSAVQAQWPSVAALYFDSEGQPING